jgi:hypothetical protein
MKYPIRYCRFVTRQLSRSCGMGVVAAAERLQRIFLESAFKLHFILVKGWGAMEVEREATG